MKIPKKAMIELITANDDKSQISRPYLDLSNPSAPVAVACNGRTLAVVPVTLDEDDTAGYISDVALKHARKVTAGRYAELAIRKAGTNTASDGTAFPSGYFDGYPNWKSVVPSGKPTVRLKINPEMLLRLAKALDAPDGVDVDIYEEHGNVIVRPRGISHLPGLFGCIAMEREKLP
jgi:hypothetical protein